MDGKATDDREQFIQNYMELDESGREKLRGVSKKTLDIHKIISEPNEGTDSKDEGS